MSNEKNTPILNVTRDDVAATRKFDELVFVGSSAE